MFSRVALEKKVSVVRCIMMIWWQHKPWKESTWEEGVLSGPVNRQVKGGNAADNIYI